jgi:hypothetical protein
MMSGCVLLALALPQHSTPAALAGFALFLLAGLAPVAMSVITWIWLGGREGDDAS